MHSENQFFTHPCWSQSNAIRRAPDIAAGSSIILVRLHQERMRVGAHAVFNGRKPDWDREDTIWNKSGKTKKFDKIESKLLLTLYPSAFVCVQNGYFRTQTNSEF